MKTASETIAPAMITAVCLATLALPTAWAQGQPPQNGAAAAQPPAGSMATATYEQQVSYSLGLNIGSSLRGDGVPVDLQALMAGIADALNDAQPKISEEQRREVLTRFQREMEQKANARMAGVAGQNKQRGEAFLTANAKKEGVQVTRSGLQYKVIERGTGATPKASDTVRCHYHGTLIDGTVFDSSYKRGEPAEFPVGGVIAGWTEALQMMKVGGKWEVYLPSDIAYGARGAGGAIGPNETLVFTIELLDIVN